MAVEQEYLNTREVAKILAVSPRTIEKWRVTGEGPRFYRLGRVPRYSRDDIRSWVESRGYRSTTEYRSAVAT
jgi:excisionase family DNA binding protein